MPHELVQVLQNPRIFKIGLNLSQDIMKLQRSYSELNNDVRSIVEIRRIIEEYLYFDGCLKCSLRVLVDMFLDCEFEKPPNHTGQGDRTLNDQQKVLIHGYIQYMCTFIDLHKYISLVYM